jgi:hypothetical protein
MSITVIAVVVSMAVGLSTIIANASKGYLQFKKWRKEKLSKLGNSFSGNWDNQGQIIKNRPTHYVDIEGRGNGKKFEGWFNVRNSHDENSWEMFLIRGKRLFKKVKCQIVKIKDGEEVVVAEGILEKDPIGLRWILGNAVTDQFPKEAVLRRGLPKIA